VTSKAISHELPPALMAEVGEEHYERLKLYRAILSFPAALVARVLAAHRSRQAERVDRIIRTGLAAMD
jgi:hypothetical protein